MIVRATVLVLLATAGAQSAEAQLSGLNRLEYQIGNTPFTEPGDMATTFDQLNLRYDADAVRVSGRVESFLSADRDLEYTRLAQYAVAVRREGLDLTVGHFYDIIGRGLLLRGFEIPGAVYEDAAYRVRQSFRRDIEGFTAGYTGATFDLRVLRGRPLVSVFPPTVEERLRRPDLVEAAAGHVRLGSGRIGAGFLRNRSESGDGSFATVSADWSLPAGFAVYGEVARQVDGEVNFVDFGDETRHALYAALTYARPGLGGSLEIKRYRDFFLGAGFNDPPSLVREHAYAVLNRSTHLVDPAGESGVQAEVYVGTPWQGTVTANVSEARSDLGSGYRFREAFLEVTGPPAATVTGRVFVDLAEDEFKRESNRLSAGVYAQVSPASRWAFTLDLQGQTYGRPVLTTDRVTNFYAAVSASRSSRFGFGVVYERSTDVFLTDDPRSPDVETDPRHWLGATVTVRPLAGHTIDLFAGTRRGGPACTSGICYEVLDFEGAEVRYTARF